MDVVAVQSLILIIAYKVQGTIGRCYCPHGSTASAFGRFGLLGHIELAQSELLAMDYVDNWMDVGLIIFSVANL